MRVRIVCYEDVDSWILGKFALKMHENLKLLNIESDISKIPDKSADINHHIIYCDYDGKKNSIDTVMITHIDNIEKRNQLKKLLNNASMGICMSRETMDTLASLDIPREKLCYINPAHDGVVIPRQKVVGLTCRVQDDGRKREFFLNRLAKDISAKYFSFKIMGDGWDEQVNALRKSGFIVEYYDKFDYGKYVELIPSLDYYLYMGEDEGQMGFVDALAAGVETIVTSQGYHLDAENGIVYPFRTYDELLKIFRDLTFKRESLINSVSTWNWNDYTRKHVEIWNYLIGIPNYKSNTQFANYNDGLNSLHKESNEREVKISFIKKHIVLLKLKSVYIRQFLKVYTKALKKMLKSKGLWYVIMKMIKKLMTIFSSSKK
jgi:hypothetical protein